MSNRRLLYSENRVRQLFARMRGDLHQQHLRHLCEMSDLRRELDEVRGLYAQLRAAVLARQNAEQELADLRRQRSLVEAWAAGVRDPATRLQ